MDSHDDSHLLKLTLTQGLFLERPAIENARAEVQRRGVAIAIRALNAVRLNVQNLISNYDAKGAASFDPDELADELIGEGAKSDKLGQNERVRMNLSAFILGLLDQARQDELSLDAIIRMIEDSGDDKEDELSSIRVICEGRRLCRALVGGSNRIGLLAEVNALHCLRFCQKLTAAEYNRHMQLIADQCQSIADEEAFGSIIDECNSASSDIRIPTLQEVALRALISGVSEIHAACLVSVRVGRFPADLWNAFGSTAAQIDAVGCLCDDVKDRDLLTMAEVLPLYQTRTKAAISGDSQPFAALLDEIGPDRCERLVEFIEEKEESQILAEMVIDDVFRHFPQVHASIARKRLPEDARIVFELVFMRELDTRTVAFQLGIPEPKVIDLYEQAVTLLAEMMP